MPGKFFKAAPILVLTVFAVYQASTRFQQSVNYTSAQTEISFWGRANYQPEPATIERTGGAVAALVEQVPGHPDYLALQASYAIWIAHWAGDLEDKSAHAGQSVDSQYQALQSRPAHRHSWVKMVEYSARTPTGGGMLQQARGRLQLLQPRAM